MKTIRDHNCKKIIISATEFAALTTDDLTNLSLTPGSTAIVYTDNAITGTYTWAGYDEGEGWKSNA